MYAYCEEVGNVRKLDILMFNLIQKITHNTLVAYMCTCAILSLLRLEITLQELLLQSNKQSFKIVPRGGTSAEGTGGSIHTSRHSVLLEVVDLSRCG